MFSRSALVLALAAFFAPSAPAQGGQGGQGGPSTQQFCPPSQTIPLTTTNWQLPLTFQRFDPALGQLLRVDFAATSQIEVSAKFESLDSRPALVTLTRSGTVVLRNRSNTMTLLSSSPSDMFSENVTAHDGVIDFAGGSGRTYPPILLSEMTATSTTSPAELALFTGLPGNPGTVSLPASGAGNSIATGPGNIVSQINTRAGVSVTVCYIYIPLVDCNHNGIPDDVDIANGAPDRYGPGTCAPDGIPDSCQPESDCDLDGLPDRCELTGNDCDANGVPDNCQPDCDHDGIPDACEILLGRPDRYGPTTCAPDGIPDNCQPTPDCDLDGIPDRCELAGNDCDANGVPDNCQPDCDDDGVPDACAILSGSPDRYGPTNCSPDGIPDDCQPQPDCDEDGMPDRCELVENDCDTNGIPDDCQPDCDDDGVADACEILQGAPDLYCVGICAPDGIPDECQPQPDCDDDGIPDFCEILNGAPDANHDGLPDNCQLDCCVDGRPAAITWRYTGQPCSVMNHMMAAGKVTCSGDSGLAPTVRIRASDNAVATATGAAVYFDGTVNLGEDFVQSAAAGGDTTVPTNTYFHIFAPGAGGALLQTIGIHTSCSQPLHEGNVFAALTLVDCGEDDTSGPDCCVDGRPEAISWQYTGQPCSVMNHQMAAGKVTCSGDSLFTPTVRIRASDNAVATASGAAVYFDGTVNLNDVFIQSAAAGGDTTVPTNTYFHIFAPGAGGALLQTISVHTSCSQPLHEGNVFSALTLVNCGDDGPTTPSCCDDGRPRQLTMRYTGQDCSAMNHMMDAGKVTCSGDPMLAGTVRIRASDNAVATASGAAVYFDGTVLLGADFTATSAAGGDDRFPTNTYFHIFAAGAGGALLQTIGVHTSCSQPLFEGNQFASLILIDCSNDTGPTTPSCCDDGRPRQLGLRYTGQSCAVMNHMMDAGKVTCSGDPMLAGTVRIRASDNAVATASGAAVYFDGTVLLGAEFTAISGAGGDDRFPTNTYFHIFAPGVGGALLQTIGVHTSCSQPLFEGNQFASLVLVSCSNDTGPTLPTCCADGRPRNLGLRYTGQDCSASNHSMDAGKVTCTGDPALAGTVRVRVSDNATPTASGAAVYFDGTVLLGADFNALSAAGGDDRFPTDTYVHVFSSPGNVLLQSVKFHTSCSQPLFAGNQFGSILLVSCSTEIVVPPGNCCANGKPRQLSMQYTGLSCAASSHGQGGHATCSGDPLNAATVRIRVSDKSSPTDGGAKIWFAGDVALNGYFYPDAANASQTKLSKDLFIHIFAQGAGGPLLQTIKLKADCSEPLTVGDRFGATLLVGCLSENDAAASAKFCAGETTNCPCANQVAGAGCRNGRGLGADLKTLGSKSVATDDMQLVASNLPLGGPGRAFMGAANGPAAFLGNGTRCVQAPAGGAVYRFPVRFANASGVLTEGPGLSAWATAHLPQPGGAIQPGLTRYFQVWYRDANGPCGQTSNLTNAVAVTFAP